MNRQVYRVITQLCRLPEQALEDRQGGKCIHPSEQRSAYRLCDRRLNKWKCQTVLCLRCERNTEFLGLIRN